MTELYTAQVEAARIKILDSLYTLMDEEEPVYEAFKGVHPLILLELVNKLARDLA